MKMARVGSGQSICERVSAVPANSQWHSVVFTNEIRKMISTGSDSVTDMIASLRMCVRNTNRPSIITKDTQLYT